MPNEGKPINIISLALGHADLKTMQGYLMTTQDEDWRDAGVMSLFLCLSNISSV